eukprot:7924406-Pyramimonas_sp.AAC.1
MADGRRVGPVAHGCLFWAASKHHVRGNGLVMPPKRRQERQGLVRRRTGSHSRWMALGPAKRPTQIRRHDWPCRQEAPDTSSRRASWRTYRAPLAVGVRVLVGPCRIDARCDTRAQTISRLRPPAQ